MRKVKKDSIEKKKLILYTLFVSIIFFSLFFYIKEKTKYNFKESLYQSIDVLGEYKKNILLRSKNITSIEEEVKVLDKSKIIAKSYIIYDFTNKKLVIGEKENEKLPLASITKLMTAYTALENCNQKLEKELDKILIASDNVSADDLANRCPNYVDFIKNMNSIAKRNELNMTFVNPSGLDINKDTAASNFGSAIAVAKLIELLYEKNPKVLNHTTNKIYENIQNTNETVEETPFLIGSKTGFTDVAGGNLATIYEIGTEKRFAIVVLGSTKEGRFKDTQILRDFYLKK